MEGRSKKELNREFYQYYLESSLQSMRYGLVFTTVLFLVFAFISALFFPDNTEREYYLRFGIAIPFIIFSIAVTYIKPLKKHLNLIYIVVNILLCFSIFIIGVTSKPAQKGYEFYYAWVMLTIIGFFIFYRLSFRALIMIGGLQLFAYILATILNGTFHANPMLYVNNLFFIVAMSSLGFFLTYLIQNLNRKNFIHQKALSENNKKLLSEIKERRRAEEDHNRVARQYEETLDSIPDWIYVVDEDKRFVILNTALKEEHLRQGFWIDCRGKKITGEYPLISVNTISHIGKVFETGMILISEENFQLSDKTIYAETRMVPVFKDRKVVQVITIIRDRSKEKEVEELKVRNNEQKEVMLREIHHRVKNNLAIVISLLNLQIQKHPMPELQKIMKDIELRIRSMALIHEHLYLSENLDKIPLGSYLYDLAMIILGTFSGTNVELQYDLEPTDVTIETALPLGLITNELLTNSFKYAFPGNGHGIINISLKKVEGGQHVLTVKDNGIGLRDDFNFHNQNTLGMFIVRILVEQLDGSLQFTNDDGASFSVRFRNHVVVKHKIPIKT